MIQYEYEYDLSQVEKMLGKLKSQAPKALKNAINQTARKARTDLKNQTRSVYTIKAGTVSGAMNLSSASAANLQAIIRVRGGAQNIVNYKATTPRGGAKVAQKKGGLQQLVNSAGNKAFPYNGAIFQRVDKPRLPIRRISGSSVPILMRPEGEVFNKVEPTIMENLKNYTAQQVNRILSSS